MDEFPSPTSPAWDLVSFESPERETPSMKSEDLPTFYPATPTKKSKKCKPRTVPRQDSPKAIHPLNFTSFQADQEHWSWDNMPDILYQFKPDEKRDRKIEPTLMKYPIHGQILRELPILPDNIASTVEEFRVEAWMRIDRRVRLKDITDRMHPRFRVNGNALQQRSVRFRQMFGMVAWDSGNKRSRQIEIELLKKMREKGIDPSWNSTRGLTPGLINPALGEAGGRIPLPGKDSGEKGQAGGKWSPKKTAKVRKDTVHTPPPPPPPPPPSFQFPTQESPFSNVPAIKQEQTTVTGIDDVFYAAPSNQGRPEQLDFIQKFIPYDVRQGSYGQFSPAIDFNHEYGLPETIAMNDLDMSLQKMEPSPNNAVPKVLGPIAPTKVAKLKPSPIALHRNMCQRACQSRVILTPSSVFPASKFEPIDESSVNIQAPSYGQFQPPRLPFPDTLIPQRVRSGVFRHMVEQCFDDRRYLFQLPYLSDFNEFDRNDKTAV